VCAAADERHDRPTAHASPHEHGIRVLQVRSIASEEQEKQKVMMKTRKINMTRRLMVMILMMIKELFYSKKTNKETKVELSFSLRFSAVSFAATAICFAKLTL